MFAVCGPMESLGRCDGETALSMDGTLSQHSSLGDGDDDDDSGGGGPEHASPVGSDASSGSHSKKVRA